MKLCIHAAECLSPTSVSSGASGVSTFFSTGFCPAMLWQLPHCCRWKSARPERSDGAEWRGPTSGATAPFRLFAHRGAE